MSIYLHDIPLSEAWSRLESALQTINRMGILRVEDIPLNEEALGRVLVEPIWARISSPHYHAAAMDGFAVRAEDTAGAMPTAPITLAYGQQALYVDTGDPLPTWANAVVPIENVEALDSKGELDPQVRQPFAIRIRAALPPWQNIRPLGEDIVASQLVLPAGHLLRPVDLGAIAACGHKSIRVAGRPRVAILPTGSELVEIGKPVAPGDIIEFNSLVLAAQVRLWGGQALRFPITPDDYDQIRSRVYEAARQSDLVLINAGSSAGSEDYTARVVASLGEVLVHGVAVRPGHPVILGILREGLDSPIPVIGVPGYPVSAALTGEIFIQPLIFRWLGRPLEQPTTVKATLTRKITSPPGDDDYMRVAVGRVGERMLAAPLARGAGVITSLVRADGIVVVPRGTQGFPAGAEVDVRLYRSLAEVERTIFIIGSHDLTLDLMAQFLAERNRRLSSANAGSLGGLVALRRGESHLAGSHLLDPETGEYNLSYIRQYLPGKPMKVVALAERQQGLMVLKGNPKGIRSLEDLARPEVTFINRQRGAGTRLFLDYRLEHIGLAPEAIHGYNNEEYTHLAVAAAIASGRADCGLGIAAAAHVLNLDFVPLFQERYDLIIPTEYYHSDLLAPLFEVLSHPQFRQAVASLPGYDVSLMGRLIASLE